MGCIVGGNGSVVVAVDVLQTAVDEIAEIGQKFVVVLIDEVLP